MGDHAAQAGKVVPGSRRWPWAPGGRRGRGVATLCDAAWRRQKARGRGKLVAVTSPVAVMDTSEQIESRQGRRHVRGGVVVRGEVVTGVADSDAVVAVGFGSGTTSTAVGVRPGSSMPCRSLAER